MTSRGDQTWQQVLLTSGLDDPDHFMTFHRYDDHVTLALLAAVQKILGAPLNIILEQFGEHFFIYCLEHGYDKMLRTLGKDLASFIENLDALHSLLSMTYQHMDAPSFRCEDDAENGGLVLHYYSSRAGLHNIVTGLIRAVGRELFNNDVRSDVVSVDNAVTSPTATANHCRPLNHVTFRVQLRAFLPDPHLDSSRLAATPSDGHYLSVLYNNRMVRDESFFSSDVEGLLSPAILCRIFPFHILFDSQLRVKQCGSTVYHMSDLLRHHDVILTDVFSISHPPAARDFDSIRRFINAVYILTLIATPPLNNSRFTNIKLKGQMIYLDNIQHIIFISSPRISSFAEMQQRNLFISDIPLYDVTRELVLLNEQRSAEIAVSKKLDETTAELKKTTQALQREMEKTDTLLHQMLPAKVADQLRHGRPVKAEKFDVVTILFSDIVTFTTIAAAVQPMEVVDLLNDLFQRFDTLTNMHGVYKVETIGDAYMAVCGAPEVTIEHAQRVADVAVDMVKASGQVTSPATGQPLQIRVGIHSGPIVAGVVGVKMPRYCLFGDTVNTASRMESHGVPGCIHCSSVTYGYLKSKPQYRFQRRGAIVVKGKGSMMTYFLVEREGVQLSQPPTPPSPPPHSSHPSDSSEMLKRCCETELERFRRESLLFRSDSDPVRVRDFVLRSKQGQGQSYANLHCNDCNCSSSLITFDGNDLHHQASLGNGNAIEKYNSRTSFQCQRPSKMEDNQQQTERRRSSNPDPSPTVRSSRCASSVDSATETIRRVTADLPVGSDFTDFQSSKRTPAINYGSVNYANSVSQHSGTGFVVGPINVSQPESATFKLNNQLRQVRDQCLPS